jgi:patatin-like phospholipase/acyl hydrolase
MNRLLSLDGGGMRGIFTLEILQRVETLLRDRYQNPNLVLADYFNFIGGTSTGAILAGLLSWGRPVEEIKEFYEQFASSVF